MKSRRLGWAGHMRDKESIQRTVGNPVGKPRMRTILRQVLDCEDRSVFIFVISDAETSDSATTT
jgi:hypothetical protein